MYAPMYLPIREQTLSGFTPGAGETPMLGFMPGSFLGDDPSLDITNLPLPSSVPDITGIVDTVSLDPSIYDIPLSVGNQLTPQDVNIDFTAQATQGLSAITAATSAAQLATAIAQATAAGATAAQVATAKAANPNPAVVGSTSSTNPFANLNAATLISGVPNWAVMAGGLGLVLVVAAAAGGKRR